MEPSLRKKKTSTFFYNDHSECGGGFNAVTKKLRNVPTAWCHITFISIITYNIREKCNITNGRGRCKIIFEQPPVKNLSPASAVVVARSKVKFVCYWFLQHWRDTSKNVSQSHKIFIINFYKPSPPWVVVKKQNKANCKCKADSNNDRKDFLNSRDACWDFNRSIS